MEAGILTQVDLPAVIELAGKRTLRERQRMAPLMALVEARAAADPRLILSPCRIQLAPDPPPVDRSSYHLDFLVDGDAAAAGAIARDVADAMYAAAAPRVERDQIIVERVDDRFVVSCELRALASYAPFPAARGESLALVARPVPCVGAFSGVAMRMLPPMLQMVGVYRQLHNPELAGTWACLQASARAFEAGRGELAASLLPKSGGRRGRKRGQERGQEHGQEHGREHGREHGQERGQEHGREHGRERGQERGQKGRKKSGYDRAAVIRGLLERVPEFVYVGAAALREGLPQRVQAVLDIARPPRARVAADYEARIRAFVEQRVQEAAGGALGDATLQYIWQRPQLPTDPRLARLSVYVVRPDGSRDAVLDVFNVLAFDLAPEARRFGRRVVEGFALCRLLLADVWTLLLVAQTGKLQRGGVGERMGELLKLFGKACAEAHEGLPRLPRAAWVGTYEPDALALKRGIQAGGGGGYSKPYFPGRNP